MRHVRHAVALVVALLVSGPLLAQIAEFPVATPFANADILIVDQERLLTDSRMGRDILDQNAAETEELRAEGQRLDRAFEAEERSLAEQRPQMTPEEFRALADAFDEKVVRTRAEQQEKSSALGTRVDQRRVEFLTRVGPILGELLTETGASAVLDERAVLVSNENLNITNEVIKRLDEAYLADQASGDGTDE